MTAKSSDRKGKSKFTTAIASETETALATFKLPESLPTSKVDFPVLIPRRKKVSWPTIVRDAQKFQQEIEEFDENKTEPAVKIPFINTECEYIQNEVFVHLIPALVETLNKAKLWNAFERPTCFFNGIDHIAQVLWNNNPRYRYRKEDNLHLFNMPWVRERLQLNPRPYYPKSWLWPEDYAATVIQKTVRRYFVQKEDDVQEMREFWRKLEIERENPSMHENPFMAKKFASTTMRHKED